MVAARPNDVHGQLLGAVEVDQRCLSGSIRVMRLDGVQHVPVSGERDVEPMGRPKCWFTGSVEDFKDGFEQPGQ